jgi:hypothetical protein
VTAGTSKRCLELREGLSSLCLEGETYSDELLDISSIGGAAGVKTLRVHGYKIEPRWEWRSEARPRKVMNLDVLSTLPDLEHLIIASIEDLDVSVIAAIPNLRRLELSATKVTDLSPLASTRLESLYVAVAPLARIDALPSTLRRLHLEDLPALTSVDALTTLPALESLYVGGVSLQKLPVLASKKTRIKFEPTRSPRTGFDPSPAL